MEIDIEQEIYGKPEYLSAIQSALLNEGATIFRRRYYLNGSHAGFVFYLNEPTMTDKDADEIEKALKESKGVGNFKNMFIHAPNGKPDGVKIIPIAEVAAKDEFLGIKNTTAKDVMTAHRVPPQLLGQVPEVNGGFGDVEKATNVFFRNEIIPLQNKMLEINEMVGFELVAFKEFVPISSPKSGPNK
jgi:PBSX family phage portal protein